MPILNYTTSISSQKTASEISDMLAKHGATSVRLVYEDGDPTGVSFEIDTQFGMREFVLPANIEGVHKALIREYNAGRSKVTRAQTKVEQARRVSWRILKDWIEAQLAVIEAGMVLLDEVMLPYMITDAGVTFTEHYRQSLEMRSHIRAITS